MPGLQSSKVPTEGFGFSTIVFFRLARESGEANHCPFSPEPKDADLRSRQIVHNSFLINSQLAFHGYALFLSCKRGV